MFWFNMLRLWQAHGVRDDWRSKCDSFRNSVYIGLAINVPEHHRPNAKAGGQVLRHKRACVVPPFSPSWDEMVRDIPQCFSARDPLVACSWMNGEWAVKRHQYQNILVRRRSGFVFLCSILVRRGRISASMRIESTSRLPMQWQIGMFGVSGSTLLQASPCSNEHTYKCALIVVGMRMAALVLEL